MVNDGRARHELDVVSLAGRRVTLLGEAKATIAPIGLNQLDRLERIRATLATHQRDVTDVVYALFSLRGFRPDLVAAAREHGDVLLVDLPALLGESAPTVVPQ
jgi:hypothetical protein